MKTLTKYEQYVYDALQEEMSYLISKYNLKIINHTLQINHKHNTWMGATIAYKNRFNKYIIVERIEISRYILVKDYAEALDTVRHEVAHVFAANKFQNWTHDNVWKACAIKCGARPEETGKQGLDLTESQMLEYVSIREKRVRNA